MAVPELMLHVGAFAGYPHHDDDHDVAEEIGEGMYAVGYQGRASAEDTRDDLCKPERGINPEAHPGHVARFAHRVVPGVFMALVDMAFIVIFSNLHFENLHMSLRAEHASCKCRENLCNLQGLRIQL